MASLGQLLYDWKSPICMRGSTAKDTKSNILWLSECLQCRVTGTFSLIRNTGYKRGSHQAACYQRQNHLHIYVFKEKKINKKKKDVNSVRSSAIATYMNRPKKYSVDYAYIYTVITSAANFSPLCSYTSLDHHTFKSKPRVFSTLEITNDV